MPTATDPSFARRSWRLRGKTLLAACVAAAALGGLAGSASAANTTTTWYSIDQQPASASSPAQFLTATSTGQVTLDRYKSGEPRQQWTPVYPEWPASPRVTSNHPLADFFETVADCVVNWGCPFSGSAGGSYSGYPRKFVNRMYAACVALVPTGSVTTRVSVERCSLGSSVVKRQLLSWGFSNHEVKNGVPRRYTGLFGMRGGTQGRCLDAAGGSNAPGTNAAALACGTVQGQDWRQQFRFLQSGSATCKRNYPGTLCGLGAPASSQP